MNNEFRLDSSHREALAKEFKKQHFLRKAQKGILLIPLIIILCLQINWSSEKYADLPQQATELTMQELMLIEKEFHKYLDGDKKKNNQRIVLKPSSKKFVDKHFDSMKNRMTKLKKYL